MAFTNTCYHQKAAFLNVLFEVPTLEIHETKEKDIFFNHFQHKINNLVSFLYFLYRRSEELYQQVYAIQ